MGFIEETGAAQYLRDVRVTAIYEGTNGIQSMDLVGRKLMDGGTAVRALLDEISETVTGLQKSYPDLSTVLLEALEKLRQTTEWMLSQKDMAHRFAGAVPYLRGFARVLGGYYHLCAAAHEKGDGARTKLATFYIHSLLPEYSGLLAQAMQGADDLYALGLEELAG